MIILFWVSAGELEDMKSFSILFCSDWFPVYLHIHWKILHGFSVVLFSHKFLMKVNSTWIEADARTLFLLAVSKLASNWNQCNSHQQDARLK